MIPGQIHARDTFLRHIDHVSTDIPTVLQANNVISVSPLNSTPQDPKRFVFRFKTAEERVRLVYAVKVRITGDETYDLKSGMPADVELDLQP